MTIEAEKGIELKLNITTSDGISKEKSVILNKSSDNPYVDFLLGVANLMRNQLMYGIPVSGFKAHGIRRSRSEVAQIRKQTEKEYRYALDVLEGRLDRKVEIFLASDGFITGFGIIDTTETKKIKS